MVGKILIVDDVATNRIVMKVKLAAAGYLPTVACDGQSCLTAAAKERPDLILLDMMLPDMDGIAVLTELRRDPRLRRIPIVMFSSTNDPHIRALAFARGADDFLSKPIDDQTLLARLRNLMRSQYLADELTAHEEGFAMLGLAEPVPGFQHASVVAIISLRPDQGLKMRRDLAGQLNARVLVLSPDEALTKGLNPIATPDVYLLDADLNGPNTGLRMMSELRSRSHSHNAAFCLMTGQRAASAPSVAFDLGANDLVPSDVTPEELASRIQRLIARKRDEDRLRASVQDGLRMAMIDPLTGLHNRRFGEAQLSAISQNARRDGSDFAVMVVDLDRFKSVNDRWGHAAGDAVLMQVSRRMAESLRVGDLVARIGGEEFLVTLPHTSLAEAKRIAERLRQTVEATPIEITSEISLQITVSIGLTISSHDASTRQYSVAELVNRADRALMAAKSAGRNQVTLGRTAA